jgi:hypothetical protein
MHREVNIMRPTGVNAIMPEVGQPNAAGVPGGTLYRDVTVASQRDDHETLGDSVSTGAGARRAAVAPRSPVKFAAAAICAGLHGSVPLVRVTARAGSEVPSGSVGDDVG